MEQLSKVFKSASRAKVSQHSDLLAAQFGTTISLADRHCSMSVLIGSVLFAGSPFKVGQFITERVAIQMACFMAFWAGTTERLKNQSMDGFRKVLTVFPQGDLLVDGSLLRYAGCAAPLQTVFLFNPYLAQLIYEVSREVNAWFHHTNDSITEDQGWQVSICTG